MHSPVQSAHRLAVTFQFDLDEVALKSGCISRIFPLVNKLHLLSSVQLIIFTWKRKF